MKPKRNNRTGTIVFIVAMALIVAILSPRIYKLVVPEAVRYYGVSHNPGRKLNKRNFTHGEYSNSELPAGYYQVTAKTKATVGTWTLSKDRTVMNMLVYKNNRIDVTGNVIIKPANFELHIHAPQTLVNFQGTLLGSKSINTGKYHMRLSTKSTTQTLTVESSSGHIITLHPGRQKNITVKKNELLSVTSKSNNHSKYKLIITKY